MESSQANDGEKPLMENLDIENVDDINNFLRGVVHDIRNPLTAIAMANRLMEDELADEDTDKAEYFRTLTTMIGRNVKKVETSLQKITELRTQLDK